MSKALVMALVMKKGKTRWGMPAGLPCKETVEADA